MVGTEAGSIVQYEPRSPPPPMPVPESVVLSNPFAGGDDGILSPEIQEVPRFAQQQQPRDSWMTRPVRPAGY